MKFADIKIGMPVEVSKKFEQGDSFHVGSADKETFSLYYKACDHGPREAANRPLSELVNLGDSRIIWNSDRA